MKNRFIILLTFLAAFAVSTPALAAPPADLGEAAALDTGTDTGDTGDTSSTGDLADEAMDTGTTGDAMVGTGTGEATIDSDEEAGAAAGALIDAIQMGNAPLAVALALMLLVYAARRSGLLDQVPEAYTKWVVAATSIVGYVAAALMLDGTTFAIALKNGIVAGAAATGLGELVMSHLFGKSKLGEAKEASKPAEDKDSESDEDSEEEASDKKPE